MPVTRKNIRQNAKKRETIGQNNYTAQLSSRRPKRRIRRDPDSKYLTEDEKDRLFAVIKSKRDAAIMRVAYHRGLRASEIALLQLSDFDERAGTLYVHRLKGSFSHVKKLMPPEFNALRMWIRERGRHPGPLFASQMGPRRGNLGINRNRLNQLMRKYCALANVSESKAHMHVWKHSCGLHLANMGESSHMIQNHLGHVNSQSTDVYTRHFTKKQQDEAWERLKHWR